MSGPPPPPPPPKPLASVIAANEKADKKPKLENEDITSLISAKTKLVSIFHFSF